MHWCSALYVCMRASDFLELELDSYELPCGSWDLDPLEGQDRKNTGLLSCSPFPTSFFMLDGRLCTELAGYECVQVSYGGRSCSVYWVNN